LAGGERGSRWRRVRERMSGGSRVGERIRTSEEKRRYRRVGDRIRTGRKRGSRRGGVGARICWGWREKSGRDNLLGLAGASRESRSRWRKLGKMGGVSWVKGRRRMRER